jgi:hypothetical protein
MTFRSDCTCTVEEWEGNFKSDRGEYEDDAGFIEIEYEGSFGFRSGDVFGDEMELTSDSGRRIVFYRE